MISIEKLIWKLTIYLLIIVNNFQRAQKVITVFAKIQYELGGFILPIIPSIQMQNDDLGRKTGIILLIGRRELCGMKDIMSQYGISPSTATKIVDELVEQDLIIREISPEDRRKVMLRLSEKGEDLYGEYSEKIVQFITLLVQDLEENEKDAILDMLVKIADLGPNSEIIEISQDLVEKVIGLYQFVQENFRGFILPTRLPRNDEYEIEEDTKGRNTSLILSIGRNGTCTMKDIIKQFDVSPSTATHIVEDLVTQNLIERVTLKDRRKLKMKLTKKGEKAYEILLGIVNKGALRFLHPLNREERLEFVRILEKVIMTAVKRVN